MTFYPIVVALCVFFCCANLSKINHVFIVCSSLPYIIYLALKFTFYFVIQHKKNTVNRSLFDTCFNIAMKYMGFVKISFYLKKCISSLAFEYNLKNAPRIFI